MSFPSLAARNGSTEAYVTRASMNERMSPDQTAESERLVAEWKPDPAESEMATSPGS